LPAPPEESLQLAGGEQGVEYAAPLSGDPSQLVLKKQLVDIAKRLKREVEEKDLEISSLREAQGDPEALQKLVEKTQEEIRALRERLKQKEKRLTEAESHMKHKDAELVTVKSVLMRRAGEE
jgi:chromosome segregation ATPase